MDMTQRDYDRLSKPTATNDDEAQQATGEPQAAVIIKKVERRLSQSGLGKLDARDLAQLRVIILRVIDDGDPNQPLNRTWKFDECLSYQTEGGTLITINEEFATDQRMRFVEAITAAIVAAAAPATTNGGKR